MVTQTEPHIDLDEDAHDFDPTGDVDDVLHPPKVPADDPRLTVSRPESRALRLGRVFAAVAALLIIGGAVVLASIRKTDDAAVNREPPKASPHAPAVPTFIQDAPATPAPPPAPLPVAPPPLPPARSTFAPPPVPDPREQQALQQELALRAELARADAEARSSDLFFTARGQSASRSAPAPAPLASGAAPFGAAPVGIAPLPQPTPDAWDPNLQARKNAFLDEPRQRSDYLPTSLLPALSPYELKATTIIPATLITGINSDLPGPIIAQVRERVYDTVTGQHLLIPQGTRLLASYDSMVAWGQERVLMCWNRIIMPNGKSINIQCMPAADLAGQAGLTDEVDNHWDRLLAAVGLSTVLSLGTQAAAGDPSGYQPNLAQRAAGNAAGQINSAGQAVVARQINIQPTITVRPGFGVNVIVTKDMILEPYVD
jgi:type IV secretion system protein TrbI